MNLENSEFSITQTNTTATRSNTSVINSTSNKSSEFVVKSNSFLEDLVGKPQYKNMDGGSRQTIIYKYRIEYNN